MDSAVRNFVLQLIIHNLKLKYLNQHDHYLFQSLLVGYKMYIFLNTVP